MNGVPGSLNHDNTAVLLSTVGRNTDAYATIATAQQAYQSAQIQQVMLHPELHPDMATAIENVTMPGGQVAGLITHAMSDEIQQNHAISDKAINDAIDSKKDIAKTVWDNSGGILVDKIPKAGSFINDQIGDIMTQVADSYHVDTTNQGRDEAHKTTGATVQGSQQAVVNAVEDAGRQAGLDQNRVDDLATRAKQTITQGWSAGHNLYDPTMASKVD